MLAMMTVCLCALFFAPTALASVQQEQIQDGGTSADASWGSVLNQARNVLHIVALGGGAVGLTWCGIEYAYGNEDVARKAQSRAVIIAVSVIAIYLLPYVIKAGANVLRAYKWDPASLK